MKKNNKKGFFLSETMVVIAIVAVVILGVFKLFNSVYFSFMQSESYNTVNAINALSNIQKYYESIGEIDTNLITEDISYVNLTNLESYDSDYYDRLKVEFKIDSIYLIDLNKLYSSNAINDFYLSFRKYLNTLKNTQGIVLVVSLNENEYAYTQIENYQTVTLVGDKEDEFGIYINIGDEFVDPGYKNWEGEEPIITWENDLEVDTNKAGTYYKYYDFNGYLLRRKIVVTNLIADFAYTGDYQTFDVPYNGYYNVELWGAQGGGTNGGKGAYTSGVIKLNRNDNLFIYIGGEGPSNATVTNAGGYNGGGYSGNNSKQNSYGGGGATDVRLVGGEWNDATGLNSRIMVAAGGAGTTNLLTSYAALGGDLVGGKGTTNESKYNTATYLPTGATQIGVGFAYETTARQGSFGYALQSNSSGYGGGGGGGYYGGNTGYGTTGSGGSSFISGCAGVNAITSSTDRTHTNNTLHYSSKYFVDSDMQAGINEGKGKAKITYIGPTYEKKNTKFNNVRYIKDCINGNSANAQNHWTQIQAIYNGLNLAKGKTVIGTTTAISGYEYSIAVDGIIDNVNFSANSSGLQCITVDLEEKYNLDEIAVWHYWDDGRSYNNHSLYVSSDNENWTTLIDNVSGVVETSKGIRVSAYD